LSEGVDAVLERLIAQFASPYDFLRELVQNAMDAGSDRVEVWLDTHPVAGDDVVFELVISDTGEGMDEAIIDADLTQLFSSSKADDRTMAGGFGIGFVSVFAWEPEVVVLQTGRAGEAWELVFREDRSFEKAPVAEPVEGTTIHLFRRGLAAEREAIAEAVRDSLWRWARFCGLEVSFEDLVSGEPPELIQDSPAEQMKGGAEELAAAEERGETTVRVAFGAPSEVVLLRHGLVLAEGTPDQHLSELAGRLGRSMEHLRVWADSPLLRTTLARDKVVADEGRAAIGERIIEQLRRLRVDLLDRIESVAGSGGAWDEKRHATYASLHAHLALEREHVGAELHARGLLRELGRARAWSLEELADRVPSGVVPITDPEGGDGELLALACKAGIPVLAAQMPDDRGWLLPLLADVGMSASDMADALGRVQAVEGELSGLAELLQSILAGSGLRGTKIRIGRFVDAGVSGPPLVGMELLEDGQDVLVAKAGVFPVDEIRGRTVWVCCDHPLVLAAFRTQEASPWLSATALALAVVARLEGETPAPDELASAVDGMRA
jgi:hypothetical protein